VTNPNLDGVIFHPGIYQEPPPNCTDAEVIIVDFSYKPEVMTTILQQCKKLTWIDHHKSAILAAEEYSRLYKPKLYYDDLDFPNNYCHYLDLEHSGAKLAWKFYFDARMQDPPPLINHIEDRDLWRFTLPGTREINAALFSYPYDFEVWDKLMDPGMIPTLLNEGVGIERKHHKDIAELVKVCARFISFDAGPRRYIVPICSLPYTLTSDAGHLMCKMMELGELKIPKGVYLAPHPAMNKPDNFAMCYWDTKDHRIFSLRSLPGGADVSLIAQFYGGGGHKHAAGFKVLRDHELARV
jgi:hypothetical protein